MQKRNNLLACEYALWAVTIIAMGYVAGSLLYAQAHQTYVSRLFDRGLSTRGQIETPQQIQVEEGSVIGRLEIPRLHYSAMVLEGDTPRVLQRAIGRIPNSAFPGQPGNVAIAGHRDTFFRVLHSVRNADQIILTTGEGAYRYQVESMQIVSPDRVDVLQGTAGPMLTLVTCYPFSFLGSAPKRFVIHARALSKQQEEARSPAPGPVEIQEGGGQPRP